jgi:hypothetical protein
MRRVLLGVGVVAAAALVGGCGGGGQQRLPTPSSAPPVADQLRDALQAALHDQATASAIAEPRPRLPYAAVSSCMGPARGAAGTYRCATTPFGPRGVGTVTVDVQRDGKWSTRPIPVQTTIRGRRTTATTTVWGFGVRVPR